MHKQKKEQVLQTLKRDLTGVSMCIVSHFSGLSAANMVKLRQQGREKKVVFRVAKNTLLKLATANTPYESLRASFSGPVIIAFTHEEDYLPMVKAVCDFASKNPGLEIIRGSTPDHLVTKDDIALLATLPSYEELQRTLVLTLQGPAVRMIRMLQGPAQKLVRVLQAKIKEAETK